MLRRKLKLKTTLRRGTRKKLASTLSRETMARTRKSLSNLLSMPNKILPSRRRRKTKQSYLALCVESLVILLKIVRSEQTRKRKRKSTS
jgi:fructose-1,6-bisphosphatase